MPADTYSTQLTEAVRARIARGPYRSEEELLLAALEALDWRDSVDESINAGFADEADGRVTIVDGLADRIRQRACKPPTAAIHPAR
jgi:predicted transcriptional regulator